MAHVAKQVKVAQEAQVANVAQEKEEQEWEEEEEERRGGKRRSCCSTIITKTLKNRVPN